MMPLVVVSTIAMRWWSRVRVLRAMMRLASSTVVPGPISMLEGRLRMGFLPAAEGQLAAFTCLLMLIFVR